MQSAGQIEASACEIVNRFMQDNMGRGAGTVTATYARGLLLVHLSDMLTTSEKKLSCGCGVDDHSASTLIRSMRDQLVRQGRDALIEALATAIGRTPSSVLHDIDPTTADEILVFTFTILAEPLVRLRAGRQQGGGRSA